MRSKFSFCGLLILLVVLVTSMAFAQIGSTPPEYDERVKQLLEEREIVYTIDADGDFKVEFEMDNGRTQLAFIMSNTELTGDADEF